MAANGSQALVRAVSKKWPDKTERGQWWAKLTMVRRNKLRACYEKQNGLCFYCKHHCWLKEITETGQPYVKKRHKATLEHLLPQMYGGRDNIQNLVMACSFCNNQRGVSDWREFKAWRLTSDFEFKKMRKVDRFSYEKALQKAERRRSAKQLTAFKIACLFMLFPSFKQAIDDSIELL